MRAAVDGECEVHYLTKLAYASIPAGFEGLVDAVHTIEKSTNEVIAELDALRFDYVVDLHNNLRSRRVKRSLKALHFTVEKRNVAKWKLVRGWRKTPIPHIVERYAAVLTAFGVKNPDSWPTLWPTEAPTERRGLCIAIGATHRGKRMPVVRCGGCTIDCFGIRTCPQRSRTILPRRIGTSNSIIPSRFGRRYRHDAPSGSFENPRGYRLGLHPPLVGNGGVETRFRIGQFGARRAW
jgi:hypothetical protein